MTEFLPFRKSLTKEQADSLAELFKANGIEFELVKFKSSLDGNFGGGEVFPKYEIHLKGDDFEKATSLFEASMSSDLDSVPSDHYLFEFTSQELYDILLKPDEWGEFDYLLAQKILKDRGENISPELVSSLKRQRLEDLNRPEQSQKVWIYAGYFLSLMGGLIGVFIGWHMWKGKKVLPNGDKIHIYSAPDRRHGMFIFILGVIIFPFAFYLRIYPDLVGN